MKIFTPIGRVDLTTEQKETFEQRAHIKLMPPLNYLVIPSTPQKSKIIAEGLCMKISGKKTVLEFLIAAKVLDRMKRDSTAQQAIERFISDENDDRQYVKQVRSWVLEDWKNDILQNKTKTTKAERENYESDFSF